MKSFIRIVLLLALLNISGGFAKNWYVCPSGSSSGSGNTGSSPSTGTGGSSPSTGAGSSSPSSGSGSSSPSSGTGTSPSSPFDCIQKALDVCQDGDIITLQAGIYSGPGNTGLVVNIPNIQILGINVASVIIDLQGSPIFLNITVPGVVVAQVSIKNGISANANVLNGLVTANVQVGAITVDLKVAVNLNTVKILNCNFLNIQGTAVAVVDLNVLDSTVKVNLNVFLNVIISGCSFINVTVAPAVYVRGQISVRLSNVNFQNCGSTDLVGSVLQALNGSVVTLSATVNLKGCIGAILIDLETAATLNLGGLLNVDACVVSTGLLQLNANLNINILGLSVSLNANDYNMDCIDDTKTVCNVVNIGLICGKYLCPQVDDIGGVTPLDTFFY